MVFTWLNLAILAALAGGLVLAAGPLLLALVISPRSKGQALKAPYECGMVPHGWSWIRFGINYYFYALIFLAFDVDVLYLFPVAVHYPESVGLAAFVKVAIFLAVLALAVLYFWRKGVFSWPRRIRV
ncbi:MAG: NADH-quinone oxidoreductase subunit A [bacterium]